MGVDVKNASMWDEILGLVLVSRPLSLQRPRVHTLPLQPLLLQPACLVLQRQLCWAPGMWLATRQRLRRLVREVCWLTPLDATPHIHRPSCCRRSPSSSRRSWPWSSG